MNNSIDNIIEGCRKRQPKAQQLLYQQYSAKMFGVCLRYAGCREDAEDILHEAFIKIFEKIHQFEGKGSFEGWIRRIMVNTALEKYRNQYKIININDAAKAPDMPSYEDLAEDLTVKELMQFIQELSPKYRIVFNLYAIEGYSHKEISEMLEISEGTSKSNLSRARVILQEKVNKFYYQSIRAGTTL